MRRFICSGLSQEYVSTLAQSLFWKVPTCPQSHARVFEADSLPYRVTATSQLPHYKDEKVQTILPGLIGRKYRDRFRQQFGSTAKIHRAHHTVRQLWASGLETQTHALLGLFAYLPEVP